MDIDEVIAEMRALPPNAAVAREMRRLRFEAMLGSLTVGGIRLDAAELRALVEREVAVGGHRLDEYIGARDYAAAAAWVGDQRPLAAGDPRPELTVEEIRRLHVLAARGAPAGTPGAWRQTNPPPFGAVVLPPPWLVPFEVTTLIERTRRDPATIASHLAGFLTRFERIRPFEVANGRVARLAADVLLRRRDLPPFVIAVDDAARYRHALAAATAGDRQPLHRFIERAVGDACLRLIAAATPGDPLLPLRTLAGTTYPALVKAAARGRLWSVSIDGRLLTTAGWIARYHASRSPAGRRR